MNLQASAGQQNSSGRRSRVHVKKSVRSRDDAAVLISRGVRRKDGILPELFVRVWM